jgi:magnesium-dependent phosphatase 1
MAPQSSSKRRTTKEVGMEKSLLTSSFAETTASSTTTSGDDNDNNDSSGDGSGEELTMVKVMSMIIPPRVLAPSSKSNSSSRPVPKLVVFDLDGCLWKPELYELLFLRGNSKHTHTTHINTTREGQQIKNHVRDGGHSPFTLDPSDDNGNTMISAQGEPLWLLDHVRPALQQLYTDPQFANTKVGISSKTDEPNWARELLDKYRIQNHEGESVPMSRVFSPEYCIMEQCNKKEHFLRLAKVKPQPQDASQSGGTGTGGGMILPEEMIFFDNEQNNCRHVASLGVTTIYCPDGGVTQQAWEKGLAHYPTTNGRYLGPW